MLAITGGSVEDKMKVKNKQMLRSHPKLGAPTQDSLANAMLSSARSLNFITRIRIKNSGAQWSTFCHFGSYEEAHTQALRKSSDGSRGQQIAAEEAKGSRELNIEATHKNTHTHVSGQSEGTAPQDHTEGREWRAEGKGHALGTWQVARVQDIIATDNTGGHRNTPDV